MPSAVRQCWLTVTVKDTDYDADDEYVISTTVNGEKVHGKCSPAPSGDALMDARGFFECASHVMLPRSPDSTYTFVTSATPHVIICWA